MIVFNAGFVSGTYTMNYIELINAYLLVIS